MTEPTTWADAFGTLAFFVGLSICILAYGYASGRNDRGDQ